MLYSRPGVRGNFRTGLYATPVTRHRQADGGLEKVGIGDRVVVEVSVKREVGGKRAAGVRRVRGVGVGEGGMGRGGLYVGRGGLIVEFGGQHFGSAIGRRSGRGWPVRVVRAGEGCLRGISLLAESAIIRDSVCFLGLFCGPGAIGRVARPDGGARRWPIPFPRRSVSARTSSVVP